MSAALAGAFLLGAVVGYLVHFLVRRDDKAGIGDLAGILGAVLAGVVLKVLTTPEHMDWYLIGVGAGFFLYWLALMVGREKTKAIAGPSRSLKLFPFLG